jgi:anaerobic magnesium-protoporphyrin IX monomethyl ester cyclase
MIKIAFVKMPSTYANWYKRPVLGISYLSAYLEQQGYESAIFDALYHGWAEQELIRQVVEYRPDFVGFTAMTHEISQSAAVARSIKEQLDIPVVVGGPHVTALPERTMTEFPVFDYGVTGEGEITTLDLLKHLFDTPSGTDASSIKGLIHHENGAVLVNESRPWLSSSELEQLPYPAFHHYYGDDSNALADKDSYYVMCSSRGCPYHCAFCMQVLGNKVRSFSPERICDEIEYAISRYGAHTIDFADEIFLFDNERTRETLRLMIAKGLHKKIRWSGLTRANMVSQEIISLAKQSGCYRLEMGVESGDDSILKGIGKQITVEQVKRAVRIIQQQRISLGTYYILGHPNETKETAEKTIELAVELNTNTIAVGIMVPYPGTKVYEKAKNGEDGYRLLSENWQEYDKFGGKALELTGLTYDELVKLQKKAYIKLYLNNLRFIDLLGFFWQRRHALLYFIVKKFKSTDG